MSAEVKFTMLASEHTLLRALLRYYAGKMEKEHLAAVMVSFGYKDTSDWAVKDLASRLGNKIE